MARKAKSSQKTQTISAAKLIQVSWPFIAILIMTYLLPWLNLPTRLETVQFTGFVFAIGIFFLFAAYHIAQRRLKIVWDSVYWYILIYFGVEIISFLFAVDHTRAFWGGFGIWSDGLLYSIMIGLMLIMLLGSQIVQSQRRWGLYLILSQAFILSMNTIVEAVHLGFPQFITRPNSPLGNSDYFISYILLLIPLTFLVLWENRKKKWMFLLLLNLLVILLAFFVTLPTDLQRLVLRNHKVSSIVLQSTSKTVLNSVSNFLGNTSNTERFTEWKLGLQIGDERPLIGVGLGNIRNFFYPLEKNLTSHQWDYGVGMDHPHNELIENYATKGILGVIAYLTMIFGLGIWLGSRYHSVEKEERLFYLSLSAGLFLFIIFNQFLFTTIYTGILAFFILAQLIQMGRKEGTKSLSYNYMAIFTWVMIMFLLVSLYWTGRLYTAETDFTSGVAAVEGNAPAAEIAQDAQNAAIAFPYFAHYNWFAAQYILNYVYNHGQIKISQADELTMLKSVVYYGRRSVALDPQIPIYPVYEGATEYLLSAKGSQDEASALQEILQGLKNAPYYQDLWQEAIHILTVKGNTTLVAQLTAQMTANLKK
jgi:hypothetical protein